MEIDKLTYIYGIGEKKGKKRMYWCIISLERQHRWGGGATVHTYTPLNCCAFQKQNNSLAEDKRIVTKPHITNKFLLDILIRIQPINEEKVTTQGCVM